MNEALSLTSYQVVYPGVLLKAIVFPSIKKPKNKTPRESNIPTFDLKPGKYPDINRYPGSQGSWRPMPVDKKPQKIKKRR